MVYCGKPSKGCSNCRERKIRCDQKEPGCGQCEKRHQKCPGYRNLVDLMFRDESSHVIKKAKERARKKASSAKRLSPPSTPSASEGRLSVTPEPRPRPRPSSCAAPPTPATSSPATIKADPDGDSMLLSADSGCWPVTPPIAQQYDLTPSCQERGVAWFFSRFVTVAEMVPHLKFDFLREVWQASSSQRDAQIDSVLASITAVGLMGMASTTRSAKLMDAARKSYGTALRLTQSALQNPAEAEKDTTMLSVLILGLFEMLSENTEHASSVEAFQRHVNGAAGLAVMRGPAQFRTRAGRRMFSMLCQRYVVSCAQRNEPMREDLIALWHQMPRTAEPRHPSRELMPLMWKALQLRSERNRGLLTDPEATIERLLALDREFEDLTNSLPSSWKHRVFRLKQHHPAVFDGFCHHYTSLYHANVWNHILTTRLLLLETVLSEISRDLAGFAPALDPARYVDLYRKTRRKMRYFVRDITASVPQQLGLMNPDDGTIGFSDDDNAPPIATVEILVTPSPPTSPASRTSDATGSAFGCSPISTPRARFPNPQPQSHPYHLDHDGGLTLFDMTGARCSSSSAAGCVAEDEAERYMLLASAPRALVWPLFVAGMSTACSADMRAYLIGRLRTLYLESGIRQAEAVANLLEEQALAEADRAEDAMVGAAVVTGPDALVVPVVVEPSELEGSSPSGLGAGWLGLDVAAGSPVTCAMPQVMAGDYGLGLMSITPPEGAGRTGLYQDLVWV
ncbi:hypothetical protein VTJ83DRAFT_1256 [Remersonia thermophila]|uniref:Zn(2)-C6 fungal-type domain-containing protein n=1 Tax=Remersonia thermophila TaxID=72144 RepID=A0ABR4DNL5_9PEZI